MPDVEMEERRSAWIQTALHDLAQPLTALECVLFLTTLEQQPDVKQLRQAIADALKQCKRMTAEVRTMQDRLQDGR